MEKLYLYKDLNGNILKKETAGAILKIINENDSNFCISIFFYDNLLLRSIKKNKKVIYSEHILKKTENTYFFNFDTQNIKFYYEKLHGKSNILYIWIVTLFILHAPKLISNNLGYCKCLVVRKKYEYF